MENANLKLQFQNFENRKTSLTGVMDEYREWLREYGLGDSEDETRLEKCRESLDNDRLNIAFVAEFSRGKSELINALFFSDCGQRLLPSGAGRTTMCPTEIFYDHQVNRPYIRLLPIETRFQDVSLEQLKKSPDAWDTRFLDLGSPDQIQRCLHEVIRMQRVTKDKAISLGLHDLGQDYLRGRIPDIVEIPRWRHALISFPHPLLKQGLTIFDTPGLNALGTEPELTLNMLPSAQVILFVLAADTGVTRSDLEIWTKYLKGFSQRSRQRLMVVMNKIDTLWDELRDEKAILETIDRQREESARTLGISSQLVFPVSAQKGLLAKVSGNRELQQQSALDSLENYLSRHLLRIRGDIARETVTADLAEMLENSLGLIENRHDGIEHQLAQLGSLSGSSWKAVEQMSQDTQEQHQNYKKNLGDFKISRRMLEVHSQKLRQLLNTRQLEQTIEETRQKMSGNWTTRGLQHNMRGLFDQMRRDMQQAVKESEQTRRMVRGIYHRFQAEQDFRLHPKMFSIMRYRVELELLYQEAEIYRNSPRTAATEKHFVIKKFFLALVERARTIFDRVRTEVEDWLNFVLDPLVGHMHAHRERIENQLRDLQRISQSRDTLKDRINELRHQKESNGKQQVFLRYLLHKAGQAFPTPVNKPVQGKPAAAPATS
ncbi:MAG: hypothetical protein GY703_12820 [Gammaproteobacteria bacterium]|nr:hypothetical protein [Gammaproteobacteria bacterium]